MKKNVFANNLDFYDMPIVEQDRHQGTKLLSAKITEVDFQRVHNKKHIGPYGHRIICKKNMGK